jgi:hypothetical protein
MKNNLFQISSLNIYEKNSNNFYSLKKVQKKPIKRKILETLKNPPKKTKRKNPENKKPCRTEKKTRRELMGRHPYDSARGRSKQRHARGRSIGIARTKGLWAEIIWPMIRNYGLAAYWLI